MKKVVVLALMIVGVAATAASAAEIIPFVRGSWAQIRQTHVGKPTVVHFWGLTCGPCLVEMPHWAQLIKERPDLNLVLIAADPVIEEPDDLSRFLVRMGMQTRESWAFADRFVDRLQYEIDPRWRGELPRTMLIDAAGKTTVISGVSEPDEIRRWLDAQKK
jgi:thiol-disulfide isomerase/thioredoxin